MAKFKLQTALSALVISGLSSALMAESLAGSYLAGRQARYDSDFNAGAQYYTRALTRDPSNPQILESVVLAQLSRGRFDLAVPVARKMEADGVIGPASRKAGGRREVFVQPL